MSTMMVALMMMAIFLLLPRVLSNAPVARDPMVARAAR